MSNLNNFTSSVMDNFINSFGVKYLQDQDCYQVRYNLSPRAAQNLCDYDEDPDNNFTVTMELDRFLDSYPFEEPLLSLIKSRLEKIDWDYVRNEAKKMAVEEREVETFRSQSPKNLSKSAVDEQARGYGLKPYKLYIILSELLGNETPDWIWKELER